MACVFAQKCVFGEVRPNLEIASKTAKYLDDFTDKSGFFLFICRLGIYIKRMDLNLAEMACMFAQGSVFGGVPFVQKTRQRARCFFQGRPARRCSPGVTQHASENFYYGDYSAICRLYVSMLDHGHAIS
jgi:hypothetical protein